MMAELTMTLPVIGTVAYERLTLGATVVGGLIDSINPAAIGILVFLLAYLSRLFRHKAMVLVGGLLYAGAFFVTYLVAGLGLMSVIQSPAVSYVFYWVATFVAFGAGFFGLKEFILYGKEVSMDLGLFPGAGRRVEAWKGMMHEMSEEDPWKAVLMAVPLGFGAAAFELPSTGQIYLGILGMINTADVGVATWFSWLVLYNVMSVAPLLVIAGLFYVGVSSEALESWRKQDRRYTNLVSALFIYSLGGFLLYSTLDQFAGAMTLMPLAALLALSQIVGIGYVLYRAYLA